MYPTSSIPSWSSCISRSVQRVIADGPLSEKNKKDIFDLYKNLWKVQGSPIEFSNCLNKNIEFAHNLIKTQKWIDSLPSQPEVVKTLIPSDNLKSMRNLLPIATREVRPPCVAPVRETAQHGKGGHVETKCSPESGTESFTKVSDIINHKKSEIDYLRHGMNDSQYYSARVNSPGQIVKNHFILCRVDSQTPRQILNKNGFSDLRHVNDGPAAIGSGSLKENNIVLCDWPSEADTGKFRHLNQYIVYTKDKEFASAVHHMKYPGCHEPTGYERDFPGDISADNIYIVDSNDPDIKTAIAYFIISKNVETTYGVSIKDFVAYQEGKLVLEIHEGQNRAVQ